MAVKCLDDGRWTCYYRIKGEDGKSRQKREYFGRGAEGEAAARKRNDELKLKKRRTRKDGGILFIEVAELYSANKNFNANSLKHLGIRLNANILPELANKPATRLRDADLDRYIRKRRAGTGRSPGVKDSTLAREITDIKAILNWAVARNPPIIPFNPVRDYKKPAEENVNILPPTREETRKILKHASPHLTRAILLSYYIGLRPGAVELFSLTWDNFAGHTNTLLVCSADKGGPKKRMVPIHPEFLPTLLKWRREDKLKGPLIHYRGKPIKSIKTAWKATLKRAKITRRIRPYDLRHHFVTAALEEGADMKALAEIVGSRPETLMRHYQHVTRKLHRQTIAKIPPITIPEDE